MISVSDIATNRGFRTPWKGDAVVIWTRLRRALRNRASEWIDETLNSEIIAGSRSRAARRLAFCVQILSRRKAANSLYVVPGNALSLAVVPVRLRTFDAREETKSF